MRRMSIGPKPNTQPLPQSPHFFVLFAAGFQIRAILKNRLSD
jgi:hypothetical protein